LERDWSVNGKQSRHELYNPILQSLAAHHFNNIGDDGGDDDGDDGDDGGEYVGNTGYVYEKKNNNINVLVPGSGSGRLAWEIASMGFNVHANDGKDVTYTYVNEGMCVGIYILIYNEEEGLFYHMHVTLKKKKVHVCIILTPSYLRFFFFFLSKKMKK
jgi:hypothetical protein